MLASFDSNVLIYAHLEPESIKGLAAVELLDRAGLAGAVIPAQVLGEFLWVVRRRRPDCYIDALELVETIPSTMLVPSSTGDRMAKAARLTERHKIQFWDALICICAAVAGATHLLSEDMQNGAVLEGLRVINPFDPTNRPVLERLLPPLA
ncbi:MAG: PIN domain-containing protein [Geminicoccaceae bacterium]|jgi:predicted nucleic acid-binding protein|nr:PIN domain-containing protein [Geminicoccaceae bacterium]MCB9969044.1 PIN domain-containing protein [Geminicoccaceae bacterium]HRY24632.1 PIN domain-containing protein [Geminicoccaceae bacterium]